MKKWTRLLALMMSLALIASCCAFAEPVEAEVPAEVEEVVSEAVDEAVEAYEVTIEALTEEEIEALEAEEAEPDIEPEEDLVYGNGEEEPDVVLAASSADDFQIVDGVLVRYVGNATDVVIPDGVTEIGNGAFSPYEGCHWDEEEESYEFDWRDSEYDEDDEDYEMSIISVTIPSSVTKIGDVAFASCYELRNINIPSGVTEIGIGAFRNTSLESVVFPAGVKEIPPYVLSECGYLREVSIPYGVTSIGEYAFEFTGISNISIPDTVTSIGWGAFSDSRLRHVTIPEGIEVIESSTFDYCTLLRSVRLPRSLKVIGYSAFYSCTALKEVEIPEGVVSIGDFAFAHLDEVTEIKLPSTLKTIGDSAFYKCRQLPGLVIPDSVESIGEDAFAKDWDWVETDDGEEIDVVLPYDIYGNRGTYVEAYCAENAIPFYPLDESVMPNASSLELAVGEKFTLSIPGYTGTFSAISGNKKIATVSTTGVVKGIKVGETVITLTTADGRTAACTVTVMKAPTGIKMVWVSGDKLPEKITMGRDQIEGLQARVSPGSARQKVTWTTSNADVVELTRDIVGEAADDAQKEIELAAAAVSEQIVTYDSYEYVELWVKGVGTATVTAKTVNGKKAALKITAKPAPETLTLNRTQLNLDLKGTYTLKAAITPSNAHKDILFEAEELEDEDYNYYKIVSVNQAGKVKALRLGSTFVRAATYNGLEALCNITVWPAATKITLDKKKATLTAGYGSVTLNATILPVGANPEVKWSSSDKKIATVVDGVVTAGTKAGTATITAKTVSGKSATFKVTVKAAPKKITLKAAKAIPGVGETTKVKATLTKNSYSPLTWSIEGDAATVDEAGNVTAVKPGTATVTATAVNGVFGTTEITVLPAPAEDEVTLNFTEATIKKGKSKTLKVTLAEGTAGSWAFESSDPKIASVNSTGKIVAKKKGTVEIKVHLQNDVVVKVCNVTVN